MYFASQFGVQLLQRRFGLPFWQFALTATDANRFSIRLARQITGRPKILVFNWCYHGSVDETLVTLENGTTKARRGNIGPLVDPSITTKEVEFNDVAALERALQLGVACVLAEPALTNVAIVLPDPGFHHQLRELTRKYGTLLIIDETHTICAGPGGYTCAENLDPDFVVFGKPIGGGVPGSTYGFTQEVADAISARQNPDGVAKAIAEFGVPWNVTRLGCRAEYLFSSRTPRNGGEAHDAMDFELERCMHLFAMNRGILLTPFHNMALMSPATTNEHIDQHTKVFREALQALVN
jgi:glutamate-1-semialdehyde 2,1-aminomutase